MGNGGSFYLWQVEFDVLHVVVIVGVEFQTRFEN